MEEEEEEVVAEAHLVEKRQYQDLNKMVAFTNVLETFKEAEPVPLKTAGLVALVLVTTGEANAVVNLMIVTAARVFVVTEANRISMEDNSLKRNFNLKTIILHFLTKYFLHGIRPITNQKNKKIQP